MPDQVVGHQLIYMSSAYVSLLFYVFLGDSTIPTKNLFKRMA